MTTPCHGSQATAPSARRLAASILVALFAVAGQAPAQKLGLKIGLWQPRHCPADWVLHETSHYQIQSHAGLEKAKRLADHMEGMLKTYMLLFKPPKMMSRKNAVKLLKDRTEFVAYSGNPGAAGYYSPTERELVLYDTGKWSDEEEASVTGDGGSLDLDALRQRYEMDILGVAAHEGWHQYFHFYVVSWVYLPSWVNEGMGDYFYTATPKKLRGKRIPAELGRLNTMRLAVIQRAVQANKHVPLDKLIRYSQQDYYSNAGVCYAQGWSLCHFLLHHATYKSLVPDFIRAFRETKAWEKNTDAAFKKIDLAKLEAEWKAWVLAQENKDPAEEALKKWLEERNKPGGAGSPDAPPGKQDPGK